MADRGNPDAVRVGPGKLYIAPLGSPEPDDLATPWDMDWILMGYTDQGSNFVFANTFEDVDVAEELEPILVLQTRRNININFSLAEVTALNMKRAFNGGEIVTEYGLVTFEPPGTGDYTPVMIGWEAEDDLERWIFRKCIQTGSVDIPRRRAPAKAVLPMSFRAVKPTGIPSFKMIHDADYLIPLV